MLLLFFSIIILVAFKYFIHKFLEVYFDYWNVFDQVKDHIESLLMMLDHCRQYQIVLNSKKCIFCASFSVLLGHIVCRDDIFVDPTKITII